MNAGEKVYAVFLVLVFGAIITLTGWTLLDERERDLEQARLEVYTEACEEAGGLPLVHDGTVFCIDPRAVQEMGS